jgi:hypothetical protein
MSNEDLFKKFPWLRFVPNILQQDQEELFRKEATYQGSWQKRGGIGAFMMLARKWDRIENQVLPFNYDIFEAMMADTAVRDGMLDDIQDLRRYLTLVESEITKRKQEKDGQA